MILDNASIADLDYSLRMPAPEKRVPSFFSNIDKVWILGFAIHSLIPLGEDKLLRGCLLEWKDNSLLLFSGLSITAAPTCGKEEKEIHADFVFFHIREIE